MLTSLSNWFYSSKTDEELMSSYAASGKNLHLECLIARFSDDLYHYIKSQSDNDLAFDICQKTWLKVMEKRSYFQPTGSVKSWLFSIARNTLIDEFRKQNRFIALDDDIEFDDPHHQTHIDGIMQQVLAAQFDRALMALPFTQREAFILQQEGFSLAEIAEITGQGHETVKTRLRYAKQSLKQRLNNHLGANNHEA